MILSLAGQCHNQTLVDQGTRKSGCRISGDQDIRKNKKKKALSLMTSYPDIHHLIS
jgi:hypothetical protein